MTHNEKPKKFNWFLNHGDEAGNNGYTIYYGIEDDYYDALIVGSEDIEDHAIEVCKRLNTILAQEVEDLRNTVDGYRSDVVALNHTVLQHIMERDLLRERNRELHDLLFAVKDQIDSTDFQSPGISSLVYDNITAALSRNESKTPNEE